jgi:penicillin-binding protein 2
MEGSTSINTNYFKARIKSLAIIIFIIFFVLAFSLFNLQIIKGGEYQQQVKTEIVRKRDIPTQRGEIYDRNYDVPLVVNVETYTISLIPGAVPENQMENLFAKVAAFLKIDVNSIKDKIPKNFYHLFQAFEIKKDVSFQTISYLAEHIDEFPGITWTQALKRTYLATGSFSHITGYVGYIDEKELQILANEGYEKGMQIGKTGIEKQYDRILRGKDGKILRIVDVREKQVTEQIEEEVPPELGEHVVLTIDKQIQQLCQDVLGTHKGAIVVLKPHTGEILAMVSYPYFDQNLFYTPNYYNTLRVDPNRPLINRAIHEYMPASVFKIILTTAILEEDAFPLTSTVFCSGRIYYGDRYFHCWYSPGHGAMNLYNAFTNSCNCYFMTVGRDYLGVEKIIKYAREYNLGNLTGIDLPGELEGFIPTPEWKEERENMIWLPGDTMNLSIGQGYIQVTPLQLANVVSMVVNKGTIYKPFLLKERRNPHTGDIISRTEPEVLYQTTAIKKSTFEFLQKAMRNVVENGTARYAIYTKAVKVAGKTGTSQIGPQAEDKTNEWFAAYAPYDASDPDQQVVVVIITEYVPKGQWWSAIMANYVFHGIFTRKSYQEIAREFGPLHKDSERTGD